MLYYYDEEFFAREWLRMSGMCGGSAVKEPVGVIASLLETLADYTRELEELRLTDWWSIYAGVYFLQVQAQALIGIVMRGCAELGLRVEGSVDAGRKLLEEGIISQEDFESYRRVVGFRDAILHAYSRVDSGLVRRLIEGKEYEKVYSLALNVVEELKRRGIDP